jgi:hypothetical protein
MNSTDFPIFAIALMHSSFEAVPVTDTSLELMSMVTLFTPVKLDNTDRTAFSQPPQVIPTRNFVKK